MSAPVAPTASETVPGGQRVQLLIERVTLLMTSEYVPALQLLHVL